MYSHVRFSVDGTPIREFKNLESKGVSFPKNQPMRIYSSLWNADDWATRGGLVKTDWSQAPFTASYRNFNAQAVFGLLLQAHLAPPTIIHHQTKHGWNNHWIQQGKLGFSGSKRTTWFTTTALILSGSHRGFILSAQSHKNKNHFQIINLSHLMSSIFFPV